MNAVSRIIICILFKCLLWLLNKQGPVKFYIYHGTILAKLCTPSLRFAIGVSSTELRFFLSKAELLIIPFVIGSLQCNFSG